MFEKFGHEATEAIDDLEIFISLIALRRWESLDAKLRGELNCEGVVTRLYVFVPFIFRFAERVD